jgi:hypothetical protein
MMRVMLRTCVGIVCAYLLYLPVLLIVEHVVYGRIDEERVFYGLYSAFGFPFLLTSSGRKHVMVDEAILNCAGAILIVSGIVLANSARVRSAFQRQSKSSKFLNLDE